ncbi:MAG TPA: glutamate-1-semialdehyde 2,1-aminomutase [Candidatus Obscuribacterales bacterium]
MKLKERRTTSRSKAASAEIAAIIPGGVDSPFRSFHEVGGHTIFFEKARGSRLIDLDGNEYIDYLGAWGPAILGHCPEKVVEACKKAIENGSVFGAPHLFELELAQLVIDAFPSLDSIRFVNSGTEAVMSALRLARGFTGRDIVIMFEGCYHGHSDVVLSSTGHCSSTGIPEVTAQKTVLARFNSVTSVEECISKYKGQIAAIIVEPVAGSMGVIPPAPGFLDCLRKLSTDNDILLIFDEVLTGLRIALGGAQSLYGVRPDLTCFGKALGGGMPIGAYGGRREIMDHLQPLGQVYQAGTFSGNPVTMAGGIEIVKLLADDQIYERLEKRSRQLFEGVGELIQKQGLPVQLQRVGSMFSIIFAERPVRNYQDSLLIDNKRFAQFFHHLLDNGIYLPPSAVDAACLSEAHSEEEIEFTVEMMKRALAAVF